MRVRTTCRVRPRQVTAGLLFTALIGFGGLVPARVHGERLDWQPIGRVAGIEAHSARTIDDRVRIRFRNTNRAAATVDVERTVIWCGGREPGKGVPVETDIGPFVLGPSQSRSGRGWGGTCGQPDYFVEFRGLSIEMRDQ